jgi:hypothetical protein
VILRGKANGMRAIAIGNGAIIFEQISVALDIDLKNNNLDAKIFFKRCLHVVVLYITISPSHRNTFDDGKKTGNFDRRRS